MTRASAKLVNLVVIMEITKEIYQNNNKKKTVNFYAIQYVRVVSLSLSVVSS